MATPKTNPRFLGLNLNEGTSRWNIFALLLLSLSTIMLATFIPSVQPYLLSDVLGVPTGRLGYVSGQLLFWGEIIIILTAGLWGAFADKVGRKKVTIMAFILGTIAIMVFAFSGDYWVVMMGRLIGAAGFAASSAMIITLMADYASDESRGKATGYIGFMNGIGASIAATLLVRLPYIYEGQGMAPADASFSTYVTMAVILTVVTILMALTLKGGTNGTGENENVATFAQFIEGVKAYKDPGIGLAYAASFVARGNLAVVGTFYLLWAKVYGTNVLGLETADALQQGGKVIVISYAASLLTAPIFGIMTDKMHRVDALSLTLLVGAVGYGATYFISDPFGGAMMVLLVLIGMAEVGCIITSGVLIAEQAPQKHRGSIIGVFTLSGGVGILAASIVGAAIFDNWLYTGPFVFFGFAAFVVLIWSRVLKGRIKQTVIPDEVSVSASAQAKG